MNKDIEQLEKIIKCATELQDYIGRYNARHNEQHALYGWDNIVAQIWIIARNVRNYIEETKEKKHE